MDQQQKKELVEEQKEVERWLGELVEGWMGTKLGYSVLVMEGLPREQRSWG
jgi:hypothetical protein